MDREGDSPTPPEDGPTEDHTLAEGHEPADPTGHSGSRWEPRDDTGTPDEQAATAGASVPPAGTTAWHEGPAPAPAPRRRRRGLRVAAGVGAAVLLAGGGFAAGHAVGDSGPDGGPGVGRHHHGDDGPDFGGPGRTGQAPTGLAPTGNNTSGPSSPILGGLFT